MSATMKAAVLLGLDYEKELVHHQEHRLRAAQDMVRYYAKNWSWYKDMRLWGSQRSNAMLLVGEDPFCFMTE